MDNHTGPFQSLFRPLSLLQSAQRKPVGKTSELIKFHVVILLLKFNFMDFIFLSELIKKQKNGKIDRILEEF